MPPRTPLCVFQKSVTYLCQCPVLNLGTGSRRLPISCWVPGKRHCSVPPKRGYAVRGTRPVDAASASAGVAIISASEPTWSPGVVGRCCCHHLTRHAVDAVRRRTTPQSPWSEGYIPPPNLEGGHRADAPARASLGQPIRRAGRRDAPRRASNLISTSAVLTLASDVGMENSERGRKTGTMLRNAQQSRGVV